MRELTPQQQLQTTVASSLGGAIGLSIAFISMVRSLIINFDWRNFGMTIFVFCMIPILFNQYKSSKQQISKIKELQDNKNKFLKEMRLNKNDGNAWRYKLVFCNVVLDSNINWYLEGLDRLILYGWLAVQNNCNNRNVLYDNFYSSKEWQLKCSVQINLLKQ